MFNVTLFVQIANFALTYWFLKKFFFSPLIKRVIEKKKHIHHLVEEIKVRKKDVSLFQNEKEEQLMQFQEDARVDYPFHAARRASKPVTFAPLLWHPFSEEERTRLKEFLLKRIGS